MLPVNQNVLFYRNPCVNVVDSYSGSTLTLKTNAGKRTIGKFHSSSSDFRSQIITVKRMQRSGIESIRTQLQPSKPKRKITNITNSQREHMVNRVSSSQTQKGKQLILQTVKIQRENIVTKMAF